MFWALCTGRPQHLWQTDQINCIFSKWLFNSSRHLSSCILIHLWLSFSFCEIESSFSIGRVSSFIKMESAFSNAVDDRVSSFIETMGKPRKHDKWVWLLNINMKDYCGYRSQSEIHGFQSCLLLHLECVLWLRNFVHKTEWVWKWTDDFSENWTLYLYKWSRHFQNAVAKTVVPLLHISLQRNHYTLFFFHTSLQQPTRSRVSSKWRNQEPPRQLAFKCTK